MSDKEQGASDDASSGTAAEEVPFFTRLVLAYVIFFKVLFDGVFAYRARGLRDGTLRLAPPPKTAAEMKDLASTKLERPSLPRQASEPPPARPPTDGALVLLSLLQREGRFIDFLQEDVSGFGDAEIGAAARVVHDGCKKALDEHVKLVAVRSEDEGATVTLDAGYDAAAITLAGNVGGKPPFKGTLKHKGWRAKSIELPKVAPTHDAHVLAPAEIEV
ncbi:MAG: DUF2760 domain-containing protein [Deltaproteobacteria bacterium]|nr:DUF2760 domain-containing protein [Deltaproteobacteria bacterium]